MATRRLHRNQHPTLILQRTDEDQVSDQPVGEHLVALLEVARVDTLAEAEAGEKIRQIGAPELPPLQQGKDEDHFQRVAGQQFDIILEYGKLPVCACEGIVDLGEGRAVAGNHTIDRQASQNVERFARRLEAAGILGMAKEFREDDALSLINF